jgi:hypothetical protein
MNIRRLWLSLAAFGMLGIAQVEAADAIGPQVLARVVPGHSTKAELEGVLGAPWRVVQFNDCGEPMDGQGDETWEYRIKGPDGAYRLHVEFDGNGVVRLIAEIPDTSAGSGAIAVMAPADSICLSM